MTVQQVQQHMKEFRHKLAQIQKEYLIAFHRNLEHKQKKDIYQALKRIDDIDDTV